MNPIDQPDIDQFDNWLDQLIAGRQTQTQEGENDLSATAVWLNEQRLKVSSTGRVERRIDAQLKGAPAGLSLVPNSRPNADLTAQGLARSNWLRPERREFMRIAASLLVLIPLLFFVTRHFSSDDAPRSIPAPAVTIAQIGTPATPDNLLGFLRFPNLLVLRDGHTAAKIAVGYSGDILEITIANRKHELAVFSLPELSWSQEIESGSVVHLEIEHPPSRTPFEVRFPDSPEDDYEGTLVAQQVKPPATPNAEAQS